jgi:hypothetical protein
MPMFAHWQRCHLPVASTVSFALAIAVGIVDCAVQNRLPL